MATAISPPLLRMEDWGRKASRLAERFSAGTLPGPADEWPTGEEPSALERLRVAGPRLVAQTTDLFDRMDRRADAGLIPDLWDFSCGMLEDWSALAEEVRAANPRSLPDGPAFLAELDDLIDQLIDQMRYVIVSHPEWDLAVPDHLSAVVWTFRIPTLSYLRAMANLFWSSIRHPLSETTIDLSTGRVLYRT